MSSYFMGIDIGTYGSRGILINDKWQVIADCSVSHWMSHPHPGWFEHDANNVWWGDFCKLSHALIDESGVNPSSIICVGSSALGTDCLPVDEKCEPLRPAILYGIDARAADEATLLTDYYGPAKTKRLFGHAINSGDTATKILWIKRNEPEIYAKTHKFLTGSSFLTARLTSEYTIDQALATGSFRPLYRPNGEIDSDECGLFCQPEQLARCTSSTDIVGVVTRDASRETGLAAGTPVITGTGDSTSEAISVGLVDPGTVFFQYGSTMYYYFCTNYLVESYVSPYGNGSLKGGKQYTVPGTYCLGDGTNAAGTLTHWVRDLLYQEEVKREGRGEESAYSVMAHEAEEIHAGCDGLIMLPYIYGERSPLQDPMARGVLFGLTGNHDRRHINRAALEAIGYSTFQHLALFAEAGLSPTRIVTAGGGTRNATLMQIVCDMAGMPIPLPQRFQCSAFGDALLAAVGVGAINGFSGIRKVLPKGHTLIPNNENHTFYASIYPIYRDIYQDNKEKMHKMAQMKVGERSC